MPEANTATVAIENAVATVTLNRPAKRNAMSPQLHFDMDDALGKLANDDDTKVLVITGNLNRDILVKKLEEARAIVDQLQVYKTEPNALPTDSAAADFRTGGADAVLFASSSAVQSYADQATSLKLATGAKRPLFGSIGPQTSETMKQAGLAVDFEARTPGLEALVEAAVKPDEI